jgi:fatty-acyl-CoA synthase
MNITEPIRQQSRLAPDAVALIQPSGPPLSYAALEHAIDRMTVHAARLRLRAGDIVGLAMDRTEQGPALVLALALARMGVACADPGVPRQHLRMMLMPAQVAGAGEVAFDAGWMAPPVDGDRPPAPIHPDPDALCRVFASSGTTGMPKNVPVSHALLTRRVLGRWLSQSGGKATRMVAMGLNTALGYTSVLRTLWAGGTVVLLQKGNFAEHIQRHGVTAVVAPPVALRLILEAATPSLGPLPLLEAIEVAGSALPAGLRDAAMERLCPNIFSDFGSTETDNTAFAPMALLDARPGAAGYVSPGVEARAVDASLVPLPPGSEGVLCFRSDRIATGYLWDDAATAANFRDGWFVSGDVGAVWPDGLITLAGRRSELINFGGEKVSPRRVEAALLSLPGITDAAAFGMPDEQGIDEIWAAVVSRARIDQTGLLRTCALTLGRLAPVALLQVDALPRNANGKVQRDSLVELARGLRWGDAP